MITIHGASGIAQLRINLKKIVRLALLALTTCVKTLQTDIRITFHTINSVIIVTGGTFGNARFVGQQKQASFAGQTISPIITSLAI